MNGKSVLEEMLAGQRLQVVDVGARGGIHVRWRDFEEFLEVVGFEPDSAECSRLAASYSGQASVRFLPLALGAGTGPRPFYACRSPRCSGLFPPNQAFIAQFSVGLERNSELVAEQQIDTVPIDALRVSERLRPDFLKLDVQGAELDILHGAALTLQSVKMIELEVAFNQQYIGQPLFSDLDSFLRDRGFLLLGLRRTYWRRRAAATIPCSCAGGQLVHGDALYFSRRILHESQPSPAELAKWLLLLNAYRQRDFILDLLLRYPVSCSSGCDATEVLRRLLSVSPRISARLWGAIRRALPTGPHHQMVRGWLNDLRLGPADDWHDPDFF
jgi:FkbM family methyltransferase